MQKTLTAKQYGYLIKRAAKLSEQAHKLFTDLNGDSEGRTVQRVRTHIVEVAAKAADQNRYLLALLREADDSRAREEADTRAACYPLSARAR